jgi:5'(3')-deoxyribonucleotidase
MKETRMNIFVDLDGVLANFEGHFTDFYDGNSYKYVETHTLDEMWGMINQNDPHFFLNLDWMPDGETLWNFIKPYNPTVLSAPAYSVKSCKDDKKKWMNQHLGPGVNYIFSTHKAKYASPDSILIDDMDKNIIPWKEAGGIGIMHESAAKTIATLKKLLG